MSRIDIAIDDLWCLLQAHPNPQIAAAVLPLVEWFDAAQMIRSDGVELPRNQFRFYVDELRKMSGKVTV